MSGFDGGGGFSEEGRGGFGAQCLRIRDHVDKFFFKMVFVDIFLLN